MLRYRDADSPYVGLQEAALCALRSQVRGRPSLRGWARNQRWPAGGGGWLGVVPPAGGGPGPCAALHAGRVSPHLHCSCSWPFTTCGSAQHVPATHAPFHQLLFPPIAVHPQLLMALHDLGETELCAREGCHKLAWTLDACLKV